MRQPLAKAALALLLTASFAAAPEARAAQVGRDATLAAHRATVGAQVERTAYAPGESLRIDVLLDIQPGWHVNSNTPTYEYLIPTVVEVELPPEWPVARMVYPEGELQSFAFADEKLSVYDRQVVIEAHTAVPESARSGPTKVAVAVRYQACDDSKCLPPVTGAATLEILVGDGSSSVPAKPPAAAALDGQPGGSDSLTERSGGGPARRGLLGFLLLGVLGGLLLNAMPCVLPVLSLKLLGLVKSASQTRRAVVMGSLATAAGILASFWALGLAAIGAKAAGATVGWGVQFQEPAFVTALMLIVTLFCLNLWGLFEVPLPRRIAGWAEAAGGEGIPAHFTAGLFATLMATPCSAPFLGTAVGFALAQQAGVILAIFSAVGIGMALPYLLLAVAPGALRLLPKPGAWMDHFRAFMGFLLAAAAIWLLYVLSSQVSRERLAFIEIATLVLALAVWIRHRSKSRGAWRWIGVAGALGACVAGLVLATGATERPGDASTATEVQKLIPWVRFDRIEAERLAGGGQLVFVDVTADWCFTCKVNERLVLETPEIAGAFSKYGVVPMKADWTNRDDSIAAFLADHGKYGIPFYLLYRPQRDAYLFGELLTKDVLLEVLSEAAELAELAEAAELTEIVEPGGL